MSCLFYCSAELKGSVEERQRHDRSDFMEAAKSQLLSGERRVFEFFLCKVGEMLHSRILRQHSLQVPVPQ